MYDEIRIKVEGPKGKRKRSREVKSTKKGEIERRILITRGDTKKDTKVIQIHWKRGNISHIHCKNCANEWRDTSQIEVSEKFDISAPASNVSKIQCKECKTSFKSG